MRSFMTALKLFGILFLLTGILYPVAVLFVAEAIFPFQAHGSLVRNEGGAIIGSELIGQNFATPDYFRGRPSATQESAYNAASSGGSNLGPTNPVLIERVALRVRLLKDLGINGSIPSDLVTASASGLDPHISLEAALVQVPAIASARHLEEDRVRDLVYAESIQDPIPFSQPYVNVLSLNRALDQIDEGGN